MSAGWLTRNASEAAALGVPAVEDIGDRAQGDTERELLMSEIIMEERQLAEIEAALERIRTGRYGICERTGRTIAWERLRALPSARYAKEAVAEAEAEQG